MKSVLMRSGLLFAIILIAACASTTKQNKENAVIISAKALENRAAQSYGQKNFDDAAKAYRGAARVYASLALTQPWASAQLSAARALADGGFVSEAIDVVKDVLRQEASLSNDARITAHGRLAALYLASQEQASSTAAALGHWQTAQSLCSHSCLQKVALAILRTRIALSQNDLATALPMAQTAVKEATEAELANSLRVRAQVYLASTQHALAIADAQRALVLDQQAGVFALVLLDVRLLSAAHRALGQIDQAAYYQRLAENAIEAAGALRAGAP